MKSKILITGGAGYIGSILTSYLLDHDYGVVVLDDLSTGTFPAVDKRAKLIRASIFDLDSLISALSGVSIVIACAGKSLVEESVLKPELYYQVNSIGMKVLLTAMQSVGVHKIIFSSTAAVYGDQKNQPISETASTNPVNPYGKSKLAAEAHISDFCNKGFSGISFRYFNITGSYKNSKGELFVENHLNETHLIPKIMKNSLNKKWNRSVEIFGDSWPTKDGSPIRDYLDVKDLARAHQLALESLIEGENQVINLGSGLGYSVLEVVEEIEKVIKIPLNKVYLPARPGDPAKLIAEIVKAKKVLDWEPLANLNDLISSSWLGTGKIG